MHNRERTWDRLSRTLVRRIRSRRFVAFAFTATVLAVAGGSYLTWVLAAANRVEDSIEAMEGLDLASIANGDAESIASAERSLDDADAKISSFSLRIAPIRVADAVIGWIPIVGDQVRGPVAITRQAEAAVATSRGLIPAASKLSELQTVVGSSAFLTGEPDPKIDLLIASVETDASQVTDSLERLQQAGDDLRGLRLLPLIRSKADQAADIEARLTAAVTMVEVAPDLIRSARAMGGSASDLADNGRISGDIDFESLQALAAALADDASAANANSQKFAASTGVAMPGSEVSDLADDLVIATESVWRMATGLSDLLSVSQPAMDALSSSDGSLLKNGGALTRSLEALDENSELIADAVTNIEGSIDSIEKLRQDSSSLVASSAIDKLLIEAEKLSSAGALLRDGPGVALDLIAADGDKTYLVIGQTSDELRAAGGFTSSVWTIQFSHGALVSSEYIPILEFDDVTARNLTPSVPNALNVHMDAGSLYLRDVGWDPHFPAVGELALELYRLNQGDKVDGVIAVTQWGLIDLIDAIGGIETAQGFIAPEEALEVIEQGTDTEGTGFLQYLFDGLVESVRGDSPDSERLALSRAIWDAFSKKDLMIFSPEAEVQSDLVSLGWAGEFPLDQADRLAVVDSNVGWTKSDRNIERGFLYEVDLRDTENPLARLDLTYRHTGVPVGRDCSEQRTPMQSEFAYELARNSCYWDFFRVYTALGSDAYVHPELPLPVNSVADRIGRLEAGSPTFAKEFDANGDYFSGLFAIEPGSGEQVSIRYELPESVTQTVDGGLVYQLHLVAQPGAQGRAATVRILMTDGYQLASSSHSPARVSDQSALFEFDLVEDELLVVEMAPGADFSDVFEAGY